jgi:hypothetical protein
MDLRGKRSRLARPESGRSWAALASVGALGAAVTLVVAACGSSGSQHGADPQLKQRLQSAIEKTGQINGYGLTFSITSDNANGGDSDVLGCLDVRQEPKTAAHKEDRLDMFVYGTSTSLSEPGRCQPGDIDDHHAILLGTTLYVWKSAYGQSATSCKGGWDVWHMTPAVAKQVRDEARRRGSIDVMALLATVTSIDSIGDTLTAHLDPAKAAKALPNTSSEGATPDSISVTAAIDASARLSRYQVDISGGSAHVAETAVYDKLGSAQGVKAPSQACLHRGTSQLTGLDQLTTLLGLSKDSSG